jgi:hypothetical protein
VLPRFGIVASLRSPALRHQSRKPTKTSRQRPRPFLRDCSQVTPAQRLARNAAKPDPFGTSRAPVRVTSPIGSLPPRVDSLVIGRASTPSCSTQRRESILLAGKSTMRANHDAAKYSGVGSPSRHNGDHNVFSSATCGVDTAAGVMLAGSRSRSRKLRVIVLPALIFAATMFMGHAPGERALLHRPIPEQHPGPTPSPLQELREPSSTRSLLR